MFSRKNSYKRLAVILIICATIGLVASFTLLRDTLEVARNPVFVPSCNINPILSCQSVMSSSQAEIFGIPNPAFGLVAFTALLTFAVLLLFNTKFHAWIWKLGLLAAGVGVIFTLYLYITSVFFLGTICPWCFVVWLVTILIFWSITTYAFAQKTIMFTLRGHAFGDIWVKYSGLLLATWYTALIFIILVKFNQALLG